VTFKRRWRSTPAPTPGGGTDTPIRDKADLIEYLKKAIAEVEAYFAERSIDPAKIHAAQGFERVRLLGDAVEAIVVNDELKRKYLLLVGNVARLYKAILPDPSAGEFTPICVLLAVIAEKIRSLTPATDISEVMADVEKLLDESIDAKGYVIHEALGDYGNLVDLTKIDFDALKAKFAAARKHTEIEKLRGAIDRKLKAMVQLNRSRVDYLEKFQKLIDEYNAGSKNIEGLFDDLVRFIQGLNAEEQRGVTEGLSEEELALFTY
jgi:type I restriction enzyme, R subunit